MPPSQNEHLACDLIRQRTHVRPPRMHASSTEQVSAKARGVRVRSSEARRAAGRSGFSQRSVGAARPAAVSAPSGVVHQPCRHRSCGLSVRWRPAHRLLSANEGGVGAYSANRLFLKEGMKEYKLPRVLSQKRLCFSSALRGTAAPGCGGRVGTGFARAAGARVLRHQNASLVSAACACVPRSRNASIAPTASVRALRRQEEGVALVVRQGLVRFAVRPNTSIEGTSSGMLRMPPAAPHVKR